MSTDEVIDNLIRQLRWVDVQIARQAIMQEMTTGKRSIGDTIDFAERFGADSRIVCLLLGWRPRCDFDRQNDVIELEWFDATKPKECGPMVDYRFSPDDPDLYGCAIAGVLASLLWGFDYYPHLQILPKRQCKSSLRPPTRCYSGRGAR